VLYVGREKRTYSAHLELTRITKNADSTIRHFCALIESLPKAARQWWNTAEIRDFNIGVQAAPQPSSYRLVLEEETVKGRFRRRGANCFHSLWHGAYAPNGALRDFH
jgi:hypothetical protein